MDRLPLPGEAQMIAESDIPDGVELAGLAPIGVRWRGRKSNGRIVPATGCPAGEFAVTHAIIRDVVYEVHPAVEVVALRVAPGETAVAQVGVVPFDRTKSLLDHFDLAAVREWIGGGHVEVGRPTNGGPRVFAFDEDGLPKGLAPNMVASSMIGYALVGPVVILAQRAGK